METTKSYMYSAIRNGSSKSVNKHVHEKKTVATRDVIRIDSRCSCMFCTTKTQERITQIKLHKRHHSPPKKK